MTLKHVMRDFTDWCSIPGLTQIVYALNSSTRLCWIAMWLALFAVSVYQIYLIIARLFGYPIEVVTYLGFGSRPYVVFTVCNINPYKYSVIQDSEVYADLQTLMDDYQRMVDANYDVIENDHFGLNKAKTMFEKEQWAQSAQMLLANRLPPDALRNVSYTFEEFVKACYYNGVPCQKSDFATFYDSTYGACFQFNGKNDYNFTVYRAGSNFGLRLLLVSAQYDPYGNLLSLPTTKTAGVRIAASYQKQWMEMESFGVDVPIGMETMVSMQLTQVKRLKKPYGECVDSADGTVDYYSNFNYSIINRLRSCVQERIIRTCGCADPRYEKPANTSDCSVDKIPCLRGMIRNDSQTAISDGRSGFFSPIKNCSCNPSCEDSIVDIIISLGNFPSNAYKVLSGPDADLEYACNNPNSVFGPDILRCIKWYKENSAVLNVFYDGLDFEKNTEKKAYTFGDAANDLGGQTGLWLGVSIISVVEVIMLFVISCMYCITGRRTKVEPIEDEVQQDPRAERIKQLRYELDEHERMARALRDEILNQAEREDQARQAQAAHDAAVRAEADAANAAAAAGGHAGVPRRQLLL